MTTTQQNAQVNDAPFGSLIWHCSEEDSGPDVGVSIKLADDEMLWLGEITRKLHHDSGCEKLGDDTGWWIIHYRGDDSRPIAKCCDEEAARDMFDRLAAALSTASVPPQVLDTGEVARLRQGLETILFVVRNVDVMDYKDPLVKLSDIEEFARAALEPQAKQ